MDVRNFMSAIETAHAGEYNSLPSETQQGESPSIRQILDRYTKGLPLGVSAGEPVWDDEDIPDFRTMDLAELAEYREELANRRYELEEELKERKKKAKEEPPAPPAPQEPPVSVDPPPSA